MNDDSPPGTPAGRHAQSASPSPGGSALRNELGYLLRGMIRSSGPLRFDRFLEVVLYGDPHGYYRNHVPGADSDYLTSPTLTPWFGRLFAGHLEREWTHLGSPEHFTVVEAGAGNGDLAASTVAGLTGGLEEVLTWVLVEPLDTVAGLQRSRLGTGGRFRWAASLKDLEPVTGIVVAHEVLDNFPFRRFEVGPDGPLEIHIGTSRTGLQEVLRPPGPAGEELAAPAMQHLTPGDRFELHEGLQEWVSDAAAVLERGSLLVVDYGDMEPDLWLRRPGGSMVTYRRGELGTDPLVHIGDADITAHVNFSALERAARTAGLAPQPHATQREWLQGLGIDEVVTAMRRHEERARTEGRHADYLGLVAERSRVQTLAAAGGLGDYLVFTARR